MAKQVVTESHAFDNVAITVSYDFEPALIGKKEREEVIVHQRGSSKIVKYWVYVPEKVQGVEQSWKDKQDIVAKRRAIKAAKKLAVWNKLQYEKNERIKRYAQMALSGELFTGNLKPTAEDCESARKLQNMSKRAQNKQLCKIC